MDKIINKSCIKVIYNRPKRQTEDSDNKIRSFIESVNKLMASSPKESEAFSFSTIYDSFLQLSMSSSDSLPKIFDDILKSLINKVHEELKKVTRLESEENIKNFMETYIACEKQIEKIKAVLMNNITNFNSTYIIKLNCFTNKHIILENLKSTNIFVKIKNYIISKENIYGDNFIFDLLNFLVSININY